MPRSDPNFIYEYDYTNSDFAIWDTGWSDMSLDDLVTKFNVYGIPDYDNAPVPYIGHLFMSRPSLEISTNINALRENSQLNALMTSPFGSRIAQCLDRSAQNYWLPIITTRAKNYAVQDLDIKSVEKGTTFYGHTITYAKCNDEHKFGGSVTIDFRNDRYLSVLMLMSIWVMYINNITKNDSITVFPQYEEDGILDYCGSAYFILTDWSNHRIVYWDKLTGIRPKKIPYSIFSWDDTAKVEDTISIDFDFGNRSDPMDPAVLMDFNVISGRSLSVAKSVLDENSGGAGLIKTAASPYITPKYSTRPFIVSSWSTPKRGSREYVDRDGQGVVKYYLEWEVPR